MVDEKAFTMQLSRYPSIAPSEGIPNRGLQSVPREPSRDPAERAFSLSVDNRSYFEEDS